MAKHYLALLASITCSALLASYTFAEVIQFNNENEASPSISIDQVYSTMYFYHIQRQSQRCLDFLDFKEDFTVSTMRKSWSNAETHYGDGEVDTHPEELPPANPGTLEGDMQVFYSISQRCVTGIHHLVMDLSMHSGNGIHFMQNILDFEDQITHLLNLLEMKLDLLGITPMNNVTHELLTTATYTRAKKRDRKERDFLYLSHCLQGLEFINVVSLKH